MATAINQQLIPSISARRGTTWPGMVLAFLVFFIVAFPKGGIKVAGVPLTIGYVMTLLLLLLAMFRAGRLSLPLDRAFAFLPCLLLGLWSVFVVATNGTNESGFTISYFVSVLYLPTFGLICFSSLILDKDAARVERSLLWAVRFIVIYGIFLFFFKQLTGRWIEVPYLTVNAADVGQLDDKYINRGGIFKLISTYNNGNIFGISLAIIAPLYLRLERRRPLEWAFYAAMFLTLSRTAWIAAVLIMFLRSMSKGLRPMSLLYLSVGLLLIGAMLVGLLNFMSRDISFIFDSNLGGRAAQLDVLSDIHFTPEGPVSALPEIVYLGVLRYFGVPGFLLFVAHLLISPLLLRLEGVRLLSLSHASACMQGMLVYTVIAGADAAFSFIPVMMIFWMVAGMGFWYARRHHQLLSGPRETPR